MIAVTRTDPRKHRAGRIQCLRHFAGIMDENGNAKLDSRLFGIPKEPVGASNNPPGRFGPPRFGDAAFVHRGDQTAVIRLVEPR